MYSYKARWFVTLLYAKRVCKTLSTVKLMTAPSMSVENYQKKNYCEGFWSLALPFKIGALAPLLMFFGLL